MAVVEAWPGPRVVGLESVSTVRVVSRVGVGGWVAVGVLDRWVRSCRLGLGGSLVEPGPDRVRVGCPSAGHGDDWIILQWDADPKWATVMLASRSLNIAGCGIHGIRRRPWAEEVVGTQTEIIILRWRFAHASRAVVLVLAWPWANPVPWLSLFKPEVHDYHPILRVSASSVDVQILVRMGI